MLGKADLKLNTTGSKLDATGPQRNTTVDRLPHRLLVPLLLAVTAVLAVTSLFQDSITFDEPAHLTAGFSYLNAGDFRLQPEHPPLAKILAALPLLMMDHRWPGPDTPGWHQGDFWQYAEHWFAAADADRLVTTARIPMVALLLATCLAVYAAARTLFGRTAGLLALTLGALSPTLLAHGRIVGNDVPGALVILLALLTYARALEKATAARLGLAGLAFAALPLVKFSWFLTLPAILLMTVVHVFRGEPTDPPDPRRERRLRAVKSVTLLAGLCVIGCLAVWTAYGWSFSAFRGEDRDTAMFVCVPDPGQPPPTTREAAWEMILHDNRGQPAIGVLPSFVRFARQHELLPEAYLYGLAQTAKFTASRRPAYLNGKCYAGGRPAYFPLAFALKTPIPSQLLMLAGVLTLALRRTLARRAPVLLVGLGTFAALFAASSIGGDFNLGQRHLIPFYVAAYVCAGAAAAWLTRRIGRVALLAALAWLLASNLWNWPNYLAYFNELAGGPSNGYRYLADSNIDWGQNAKRVARYATTHPDETLKLSYFGSVDPRRYVECEALPSLMNADAPVEFTAGTYIISVNELLGIYNPLARDEAWRDGRLAVRCRQLRDRLTGPPEAARDRRMEHRTFQQLRWARLLAGLRHTQPHERIGNALFVYRLTDSDIDQLACP